MRVYKARSNGDERKARNLQKLIIRSQSAQFLAVRKVTQLNTGKNTAGIDGKKALTPKERFALAHRLMSEHSNWKHSGLKNVPIPKKNGSVRMLKIPTIADRAWQCLAKEAIEPLHEATFHAKSYGFRPGRSTHDVQKVMFLNLSSSANGVNKRVLELDIEKCFDQISHSAIMKNVIAPKSIKIGLFRCLKAGTDIKFPDKGTPQGGVISPLLANIVLNGIEDIHPSVRYADDMVYFLKEKDNPEAILEKISKFLAERGLKVSEQKTHITSTKSGFDFCGWHFICQENSKFKSYPSADNYKKLRENVKETINKANWSIENRVRKLAPIVRGWRNYHKYCDMSSIKFKLRGMEKRACKVFNTKKRNKTEAVMLMKKAFPAVSYAENQFINVKGGMSVFNGNIEYWSKRNSKLYDSMTSRALQRQHHSCAECGLKFTGEEPVQLHHVDGNHENWKGINLKALHKSCHMNLHSRKAKGLIT